MLRNGRRVREVDGYFSKRTKFLNGNLQLSSSNTLPRIARAYGCDQPATRSPFPAPPESHRRTRRSSGRIPTAAETFPRPLHPARARARVPAAPLRAPRRASVPPSRHTPSTRWPVKLRCYIHAAHLRSRSRATLPHFLSLDLSVSLSTSFSLSLSLSPRSLAVVL